MYHEITNADRANRAFEALIAYKRAVPPIFTGDFFEAEQMERLLNGEPRIPSTSDEDVDYTVKCAVKDLLGDLRHMCEAHELDFDLLNDDAASIYSEERDEEALDG